MEFYGEDTTTAKLLATQGTVRYCMALRANASDRRFVGQGLVTTTALYVGNYLYVTFMKRPLSKEHRDFRMKEGSS